MADTHTLSRRLATYSYLRPLLSGARVLELGCGDGTCAHHLVALGARAVVGADADTHAIDRARRGPAGNGLTFVSGLGATTLAAAGPFDVVLIPHAAGFLRADATLSLPAVAKLLAPGGRLVCVAPSADAPGGAGGVGYFELGDALVPHFRKVRMFGLTQFFAFGLAQFEEAASGLRLESGLVDEASEAPSHYVAIGGPDGPLDLGYALVQVPIPIATADVSAAGAPVAAADPIDLAELRRKLAEAQGQSDGVLRVSRAQTEELEELRGRLRRGAEARAALDDEVSRLRRALTDADESVLNLTRRTTEEVTSLAQQLTAGLRAVPGREQAAASALAEQGRRHEAELAAAESALGERDERIALLEAERQDLLWRLDAADERALQAERRPGAPVAAAAPLDEITATLRARELAIDQFRVAAAAHRDEVSRLRAALGEQSTLVVELEEAVLAAEARLGVAEDEAGRLRVVVAETEEADRARRSRLAELEGTLLRLQRTAAEPTRRPDSEAALRVAESQVAQLKADLASLVQAVTQGEQQREEAQLRWGDAVGRIVGLEQAVAQKDELARATERERARLYERLGEFEAQSDAGQLSAALEELTRLRGALERSEEQLWEVKATLGADRERLVELGQPIPVVSGRALVATDATYQSMLANIFKEMAALEAGLRTEVAHLAQVERALADCTAAAAPRRDAEGTTSDIEP